MLINLLAMNLFCHCEMYNKGCIMDTESCTDFLKKNLTAVGGYDEGSIHELFTVSEL